MCSGGGTRFTLTAGSALKSKILLLYIHDDITTDSYDMEKITASDILGKMGYLHNTIYFHKLMNSHERINHLVYKLFFIYFCSVLLF